MARPLRIEYENAFYHVISRGHRKDKIFLSDGDKDNFLEKLKFCINKFSLKLHAYVLMSNHYHLLIQTPLANLSKAIHYLNSSYSNWFKFRYDIYGSLFQGRYKSILVEKTNYFSILSAYIHLNPVRANIVKNPEDYAYSSCKNYFNADFNRELLYSKFIMDQFQNRSELYKKFVMNSLNKDYKSMKSEIYGKNGILGSKKFMNEIYEQIKTHQPQIKAEGTPELKYIEDRIFEINESKIIEEVKKLFLVKKNELYKRKKNNIPRLFLMYGLKNYTGMKLNEIGDLFNISYAAVTMNIKSLYKVLEKDQNIKLVFDTFNMNLKNLKMKA